MRTARSTRLRVLTVADSSRLGNRVFVWLGRTFAMVTFVSPLLIDNLVAGLASSALNAMMWMLVRSGGYRALPAALIFSLNVMVFVSMPILYIGAEGLAYDFIAHFTVSGANTEFTDALPSAIWALVGFVVALVAGVWCGSATTPARLNWRPMPTVLWALLALGGVSAYVAMADNAAFFASFSSGATRVTSLLTFLLIDHAYLLVFPLVFYGLVEDGDALTQRGPLMVFGAVLVGFTAVFLSATSKGALLNMAWYLFVFPLAIGYRSGRAIYWPSRGLMVAALLAALPLFFVAQLQRQALMAQGPAGEPVTINGVLTSLRKDSLVMVEQVADRLGASFQNYVMIYARYSGRRDPAYVEYVAQYMLRSFVNLVWMGTPYPDAYFPSSQQLPSVLDGTPLVGYGDAASFWAAANTQPYTGWGALMILIGPVLTLPALFVGGFMFAVAYRLSTNVFVHGVLALTVNLFFQVYGPETTVQFVLHVVTASVFMLLILRLAGKDSRRSAVAA